MRSEHLPALDKIERFSRALEVFFILTLVFAIVVPLGLIGYMAITPNSSGESFFLESNSDGGLNFSDDDLREGRLTIADKLLASAFLISAFGCFVFGLCYLVRLMRRFKHHQVFGAQSVRFAKGAAFSYLAAVLVLTICTFIIAVVTGDFHLNGRLFQSFLGLGLAWLFVWIMQIGTDLYVENEMTV